MIRVPILLRPQDAGRAAALHARCFPDPWSEPAFAATLSAPGALGLGTVGPEALDGFALAQVIAGEADLLTIATAPELRRTGIASGLIVALERTLSDAGATRLTLEVAEDNLPARSLYRRLGFVADGRRAKYYKSGRDVPVDAILMSLPLGT